MLVGEVKEQDHKQPNAAEPATTRSFDGLVTGPGGQIGPFRIERELGRGAVGVVYLAHDTKLDRPVAIKSLPAEIIIVKLLEPDRENYVFGYLRYS